MALLPCRDEAASRRLFKLPKDEAGDEIRGEVLAVEGKRAAALVAFDAALKVWLANRPASTGRAKLASMQAPEPEASKDVSKKP